MLAAQVGMPCLSACPTAAKTESPPASAEDGGAWVSQASVTRSRAAPRSVCGVAYQRRAVNGWMLELCDHQLVKVLPPGRQGAGEIGFELAGRPGAGSGP